MRTEVKVQRGTRETVYVVDLPIIPEGHTIISPASGPVQVLLVTGGSEVDRV